MGKPCDLCDYGKCQNKKVHLSKQAADMAYCNVVRASKYAENCKADVKAGREVEDELEYGTLDMEEGEAKEMAKAEGVALAARLAAARESDFERVEKRKVAELASRHGQQIDAELRGMLVEHKVEEEAWRLEKVGIVRTCDVQRLWAGGADLFGEDGYSRGSLEIVRKALREYAPLDPEVVEKARKRMMMRIHGR